VAAEASYRPRGSGGEDLDVAERRGGATELLPHIRRLKTTPALWVPPVRLIPKRYDLPGLVLGRLNRLLRPSSVR
jgi:hypothetical protein